MSSNDILLEVENLRVSLGGNEIIKGISFNIRRGEVCVIMGPNGSGKSTIAYALTGKPGYESFGKVLFMGEDLLSMTPDERSRKGLFLCFQSPPPLSGVSLNNLLRESIKEIEKYKKGKEISVIETSQRIKKVMEIAKVSHDFLKKNVNEEMSGGEIKKSEIIQMIALEPKLTILDEIDSGLDIDKVREVGEIINKKLLDNTSFLIITHYPRLLNFLNKIDNVYILYEGLFVASGKREIIEKLEKYGYSWIREAKNSSPHSG